MNPQLQQAGNICQDFLVEYFFTVRKRSAGKRAPEHQPYRHWHRSALKPRVVHSGQLWVGRTQVSTAPSRCQESKQSIQPLPPNFQMEETGPTIGAAKLFEHGCISSSQMHTALAQSGQRTFPLLTSNNK